MTAQRTLIKREFEILSAADLQARKAQQNDKPVKKLSQRQLAEKLSVSVGTINKTVADLQEKHFLDAGIITSDGIAALEPYRVQRAVFIAAGFGSRLVPITFNTPKPLVRVHGVRLIDRLLDAVIAAGIDEIYIVRGYLAEQFDILKKKYPMVQFLENPMYNEANNISSAEIARFLIGNAYVLEADLLLSNPDLITRYQYETNYLAIPMEKSDDWCFPTKNGVITGVQVGGLNVHQMVGISYWTQEDGDRLANHIDEVFNEPGGKERYWDNVALTYHIKDYQVHIRECTQDDIIEIDTFNELKAIDSTYDI